MQKIADKLQLRLTEADIHIDKYIDQIKEKVDVSEGQIQELIAKVSLFFIFNVVWVPY